MYRFTTLIQLFFVFVSSLTAQQATRWNVPVAFPGKPLKYALAGGLNCPQPSAVDLNRDGLQDLYIFDRVGDVQLTFLNKGTPGITDYEFAPEYIAQFPELRKWVLLRDYNGDGIMDIFAFSDVPGIQGMIVYRGYYAGNKIAFDRVNLKQGPYNLLYFPLSNNTKTQVFISSEDYPAVDDIDGDGDLDIVTFSESGGNVYLFSNMSVEKGYGRDSLQYELTDNCWGRFYERGLNEYIELSSNINICNKGLLSLEDRGGKHVGSTLVTLDKDNDGDKEVVLGDISFSTFNMLTNTGSRQTAFMTQQDPFFPSYDTTAFIPIFPAPFYLDLDNDGKKDFVGAPNQANISLDYNCLWFYKNTVSNEQPKFNLRNRHLLVEDMVDMGTGSHPAIVDYNGDGLLDIISGNFGFFIPFSSERDPRLYVFRNVGTKTNPSFVVADTNYLNMRDFQSSTNTYSPAFGDIDNDGDLDLLVGEESGSLFYYENIAGPGKPLSFKSPEYPYKDIDIGNVATPYIMDVNRDGRPDIVIGERSGNLNYLKNIGTPSKPNFSMDSINTFFGKIRVNEGALPTGYSSPTLLDLKGRLHLICGAENGALHFYNNIDGNLDGTFTEITPNIGNIREGARTHAAAADLNDDGFLDLVIGNFRGGIALFNTNIRLDGTIDTHELANQDEILVYPNPTSGQVQIVRTNDRDAVYRVFNTLGQLLESGNLQTSAATIDLGILPRGLVYIRIEQQNQSWTKPLILR